MTTDKSLKRKELIAAIHQLPGDSIRERWTNFVYVSLALHKGLMAQQWWGILYSHAFDHYDQIGLKAIDAYTNAAVIYMSWLQETQPFSDLLGPLFGELIVDKHTKKQGQAFTPEPLAHGAMRFMPPQASGGKIMDPTCGSGTLLLVACQKLTRDVLIQSEVHGNDRDPLCAAMTALQLMANQYHHQMHIGRMVIECKDIITEYLDGKPLIVTLAPAYHRMHRMLKRQSITRESRHEQP